MFGTSRKLNEPGEADCEKKPEIAKFHAGRTTNPAADMRCKLLKNVYNFYRVCPRTEGE